MTLIHVFPGQGSHRPGIGRELFLKFPHLVRQADSVLDRSITDLCLNASARELTDTRNTQTAMYVVNALSYLEAVRETGRVPDAVAGHSLGEYVALFAAGTFDFLTGLEIVVRRGELMAQAPEGGMAAIMGVDADRIREILTERAPTVDVANLNAPGQTVVSGPRDDIAGLRDVFGEEAKAVVPLNVGGAFHSRYMADAAAEFGTFLAQYRLASPRIDVISNVTARPYATDDPADLLIRQIASPVRWAESVEHLLDRPEPEFREIGPGQVLTGLVAQIRTHRRALSSTA
ncbi:ACP S-malonyltransferase [Streptomyces sp. TRM 70361]|uniref:ACP S-malonyltransferase n=1 Tax=Streptomyces sp. TRM 70361 TaxID=3116553 RepID=UPI002E7AD7DE|nr:ACP S-malonyltransferase [Streptomyces sp. TRM 70361]MEE1940368.1 ACP S-malonyltransferase [Streptomyces sp. TRM 70361]